jgi:hypothetical protein
MFCPRCAAQNADDAKYCRGCGADISLVPQAVTGQLAERLSQESVPARRHGRERPATIERAVKSFIMGLGFVFVAIAISRYMRDGESWWFWLLIPAFALIGEGVATYLRLKQDARRLGPPVFEPSQQTRAIPPAGEAGGALPPRDTSEIIPPPSVTEGTTRHLSVPVKGLGKEL